MIPSTRFIKGGAAPKFTLHGVLFAPRFTWREFSVEGSTGVNSSRFEVHLSRSSSCFEVHLLSSRSRSVVYLACTSYRLEVHLSRSCSWFEVHVAWLKRCRVVRLGRGSSCVTNYAYVNLFFMG